MYKVELATFKSLLIFLLSLLSLYHCNADRLCHCDARLHQFIYQYGILARLLSDQGPNFESEVMQGLCQMLNIKTTVYQPQWNGASEPFNDRLLSMLGTLEPEKKKDWRKYLPSSVYAYNATRHESIGFSVFDWVFGRKAMIPIYTLLQVLPCCYYFVNRLHKRSECQVGSLLTNFFTISWRLK